MYRVLSAVVVVSGRHAHWPAYLSLEMPPKRRELETIVVVVREVIASSLHKSPGTLRIISVAY
jgi:hypothetical protein